MSKIPHKYIAKIEGHGSLDVDWRKEKVKLNIHEGERLFEGMLQGRTIEEAFWITPRICGVCPVAHNLASVTTVEAGLGVKVNKTTRLLRQLMFDSQMMQSHMLHLFFLSLPDFMGIDRGTELVKKNPKAFKAALDIKEVGDEIAIIVSGRNVHPVRTTIGGFHQIPTKKELEHLLKMIKNTRKSAQLALKVASGLKFPNLEVDIEFVAQKNGKILSSNAKNVSMKEYKKYITEEINSHSTAKFGSYQGRTIMVGSLARVYFWDKKNKYREMLDFNNPFHNNLAQAIELLYYHKEAEETLEELLRGKLDDRIVEAPKTSKDEFVGIGGVEAPRGGLYNEFHFDEKGIIKYANIITPTVQNFLSIEACASALVEQYGGHPQKEKEKLLEQLVRAYDPCITCSVH